MNAPILSTLPLKNNLENYTATKFEDSPTIQIGDMHTLFSSTCTIQMQSWLNSSKIAIVQKSQQLT